VGLAQGLLGAQTVVDVADDPDGAFACIARIDEPARQFTPEQAAILAAQAALRAKGQARAQRAIGLAPQAAQLVAAGVQVLAVDADQRMFARVAEDVGIALVASDDDALADEDDVHAGIVEQCLLLAQAALQRRRHHRRRTFEYRVVRNRRRGHGEAVGRW